VGAIFGLDAGGSLAKLVYFEATEGPLGGRATSAEPGGTEPTSAWGFVEASSPSKETEGLASPRASSSGSGGGGGGAARLMRGLARPTLQRVRSLAALHHTPAAAREALNAFYDFMSKRLGPAYVSSTVFYTLLSNSSKFIFFKNTSKYFYLEAFCTIHCLHVVFSSSLCCLLPSMPTCPRYCLASCGRANRCTRAT
jgi:hypothetical protein